MAELFAAFGSSVELDTDAVLFSCALPLALTFTTTVIGAIELPLASEP